MAYTNEDYERENAQRLEDMDKALSGNKYVEHLKQRIAELEQKIIWQNKTIGNRDARIIDLLAEIEALKNEKEDDGD